MNRYLVLLGLSTGLSCYFAFNVFHDIEKIDASKFGNFYSSLAFYDSHLIFISLLTQLWQRVKIIFLSNGHRVISSMLPILSPMSYSKGLFVPFELFEQQNAINFILGVSE